MLSLFLACNLGQPETVSEPVVAPAPSGAEAWDAWPRDVDLVPATSALAAQLARANLTASVATLATEVNHDTDVVLASTAAMRTGAEIAALILEASAGSAEVKTARLERIARGLEVLDLDPSPAEALRASVPDLDPAAWVTELDGKAALLEALAGQKGDSNLPLALAGGWLQALWLVARAAELEEHTEHAHELLYRPEVVGYFDSYLAECAPERFPSGIVEGMQGGMATIRAHSTNDPMSLEDVVAVRTASEQLLGMM